MFLNLLVKKVPKTKTVKEIRNFLSKNFPKRKIVKFPFCVIAKQKFPIVIEKNKKYVFMESITPS